MRFFNLIWRLAYMYQTVIYPLQCSEQNFEEHPQYLIQCLFDAADSTH